MSTTDELFDPSLPSGSVANGGTIEYSVLDVFTSEPLLGNQLAVFADGRGLSGEEMQRIARELNLSETVFLLPAEGDGDVRARIFTPSVELPFAGHPVLGTGFVVAEVLGTGSVRLETGAGPVPIEITRDGARLVFGRMRQPLPVIEPYEREAELLAALGVARSVLPLEGYRNGPRHVYVVLESEEEVVALRPDFGALAGHAIGANCVAAGAGYWKSRMFAPALGINEDPATGSAAGPLALHLARHGRIAYGEEIEIHQGEEIDRGSVLFARAVGDGEHLERIEVGGSAVVVAQGRYLVRSARG